MTDMPRPVWLNREQINALGKIRDGQHALRPLVDLLDAWDAAPTDSYDAIAMAYTGWNTERLGVTLPEAVLIALGWQR